VREFKCDLWESRQGEKGDVEADEGRVVFARQAIDLWIEPPLGEWPPAVDIYLIEIRDENKPSASKA